MTKDEALKMALEALIWTTGSSDFIEGGQAYEGAKKCLFPVITEIKKALAQSEQEPVAWFSTLPDGKLSIKIVGKPTDGNWEPLYTTPPQRTWVGLTEQQIKKILSESKCWEYCSMPNLNYTIERIESTLREKNK